MDNNLVYSLPCKPGAAYVNITARCLHRRLFCIKRNAHFFFGHNLEIGADDPEAVDIVKALRPLLECEGIREVVFCGMGEPLLRYQCVLDICRAIRTVQRDDLKTRVDMSGLFWAECRRHDVLNWIDILSISLNAEGAAKNEELCRPQCEGAYDILMDFLEAVKAEEGDRRKEGRSCPEIRLSIVDTSEEEFLPPSGRRGYVRGTFPVPDHERCREIAASFGWPLVVKGLFRDARGERWENSSVRAQCARGDPLDACNCCPHRH